MLKNEAFSSLEEMFQTKKERKKGGLGIIDLTSQNNALLNAWTSFTTRKKSLGSNSSGMPTIQMDRSLML